MNYEELDKKANLGAFSTLDMAVCVPEIQKIKPGGVYLEVGVDKGKSLSIARMVAKEDVEVIGVDLRDDPEVEGAKFFQMNSQDPATAKAVNKKIDVIFIDGDHFYEGVAKDIEVWYPYMKKGGVMLFHDCDATSPGVVQAVEEFVEKYKFKDVYYDPDQRCSMARIRL